MAFAIMQKELAAPNLSQLKRAYRALPTLRDLDAQTSANDAYGILLKGLEQSDAQVLRDALDNEGVPTEVLDESELPVVPPSRVVRAVEFEPTHLSVVDPLGRALILPWAELLFIAAGDVGMPESKKVKGSATKTLVQVSGAAEDARSKAEADYRLLADIVIAGGVSRHTIAVETFNFDYLTARLSTNPSANLGFLIQDLAQFAPHAGLTRGAYALCHQNSQSFHYPTKAAYFEEMTWMLWRSRLGQ